MAGFAASDDLILARALSRPGQESDPRGPTIRLAREEELDAIASLFAPALAPYRGTGADEILVAYLADLLDVGSRFEVAETYVALDQATRMSFSRAGATYRRAGPGSGRLPWTPPGAAPASGACSSSDASPAHVRSAQRHWVSTRSST
jgi:hypothetical protein